MPLSNTCYSTLKVYGDAGIAESIQANVEAVFGPCLRGNANPYLASERGNPPIAAVLIESAAMPPLQLVVEMSRKVPEASFTVVYTIPSSAHRGVCTYRSGKIAGEWEENLPEEGISDGDHPSISADVGGAADCEAAEVVGSASGSEEAATLGEVRCSPYGKVRWDDTEESSMYRHDNGSELESINHIYHRGIANDRELYDREQWNISEDLCYYDHRCKTLSPRDRINLEHLRLSYESEERRARACMMLSKSLDHLAMPGFSEILSDDEFAVLEQVRRICTKLRRYVREDLAVVKSTDESEAEPF
jgi:hypothetical protein